MDLVATGPRCCDAIALGMKSMLIQINIDRRRRLASAHRRA